MADPILVEVVFLRWMVALLMLASLSWIVAFAVLAFRNRPTRGRS